MTLKKIYETLLGEYGPQGWWPLLSYSGSNPTSTGSVNGYHPKDYSPPRNDAEKFEIMVGTILTQNTSWHNAEKALLSLQEKDLLSSGAIITSEIDKIKAAIRSAGYFNQKSERLKTLASFYENHKKNIPSREELLRLKGIGPETADSILLYAYSVPSFVVDSYTKRIFSSLGYIKSDAGYEEIKSFFENNLKKDYRVYQEFHALIVQHAKRYYLRGEKRDDLLG